MTAWPSLVAVDHFHRWISLIVLADRMSLNANTVTVAGVSGATEPGGSNNPRLWCICQPDCASDCRPIVRIGVRVSADSVSNTAKGSPYEHFVKGFPHTVLGFSCLMLIMSAFAVTACI